MEEFLQSKNCPNLVQEEVKKAKHKSVIFEQSKGNVDLDRQEANDEEDAEDEGAPDEEDYGDFLDPGDPSERVDNLELNAELRQLYELQRDSDMVNRLHAQVLDEANHPIDFDEDKEIVSELDMKFYLKK